MLEEAFMQLCAALHAEAINSHSWGGGGGELLANVAVRSHQCCETPPSVTRSLWMHNLSIEKKKEKKNYTARRHTGSL